MAAIEPQSQQAKTVISMYTPRATTYGTMLHGWHAELADDFVAWVKPKPGDTVLDLACGTGLVTFRMADVVGREGLVVGADVTPAMLGVAHRELETGGFAGRVELVEADVADERIRDVNVIKEVVGRGGFDIISCCSALVLFSDPVAAVKLWASLLKPGGRMIVDVVTRRLTVQYIAVELVARELGVGFPFGRAWLEGQETVEALFTGAGMEVETCFVSRSYMPETVYRKDQWNEVFEEVVLEKYGKVYKEKGLVEEARSSWKKWWDKAVEEGGDGVFTDGHQLYICIGRKI